MTCRLTRTTPARIAFIEERGPALHVPTWQRRDLTPGMADCLRCGREITLKAVANCEPCPGRKDDAR